MTPWIEAACVYVIVGAAVAVAAIFVADERREFEGRPFLHGLGLVAVYLGSWAFWPAVAAWFVTGWAWRRIRRAR